MLSNGIEFHRTVERTVLSILDKEGLLNRQWGYGEVDEVISPSKLKVFINGGETSHIIPCNPDVSFQPNDHVIIVYINGISNDKFVISRRIVR
jgi:hypothetical protein